MLWHAPGTMLEKLAQRNLLAVNSALSRRGALAAVGPWNEALRAVEDWEYWIRCAAAGIEFSYLDAPQTLALVRLHPGSASTDIERVELGIRQMREHLLRTLDDPQCRATIRGQLWRSGLRRFLRGFIP